MIRRKTTQLPKAELNITSMMDLVLNLLTFFVLCSNFAMAELPDLLPPQPTRSQARPVDTSNKVTVNLLPNRTTPGQAIAIKFGTMPELPAHAEQTHAELAAYLAKEKEKSADVAIELRADRTLRYDQVAPVMAAIRDAGISRVNVVAMIDPNP